MCEDLLSAP